MRRIFFPTFFVLLLALSAAGQQPSNPQVQPLMKAAPPVNVEQIDGKFWFPTYTSADDELVFPKGQTVHLRMIVRYTDYKQFRSKVRVIEEGEPGAVPTGTPPPTR